MSNPWKLVCTICEVQEPNDQMLDIGSDLCEDCFDESYLKAIEVEMKNPDRTENDNRFYH